MITAKGVDEKIYMSIDKDTGYQVKGFYKCRDCDQAVFLKRSNFRINHFSHFPFSRMCNQWEQDTEEHTAMKVDIYNYFKNFYWIDDIDSETPIPYNDSFIKPDIFIKTKSGDKIAIECQITKITWLDVMEKIKKYSDIDIATLFIFDKSNYIEDFFSVNTTPYDMSPTIIVMDNIHNKRFYLYNANKENKKKYGPIISFEQIGARIANRKDDKFYFCGSYFNKEDFTSYKISIVGGCKIVTGIEKPNFGKIVKKVEDCSCHFDSEWVIYDNVDNQTSKSVSTEKEKTNSASPKIYRMTLRSDLDSNNKSYNFYTIKGSKYECNFRHTVIKTTVEDLEELRHLHSLNELNNSSKDFINANYPEWQKTKDILKIQDEPLKYFFRVGKPLIVVYKKDIYVVKKR